MKSKTWCWTKLSIAIFFAVLTYLAAIRDFPGSADHEFIGLFHMPWWGHLLAAIWWTLIAIKLNMDRYNDKQDSENFRRRF